MNLWKLFSNKNEEEVKRNSLYLSIKNEFSSIDEEELTKVTSIAAIMASLAYVDFKFDESEFEFIGRALEKWCHFTAEEVTCVTTMARDHAKDLAGMEDHLVIHSLNEYLSKNERFEIVEALFELAAADGSVENIESEHIRLVVKGFGLSHQHFISARAKVSDSLKALKS